MRQEDRYDSLFQYYGWKSGVDWLLLKAQVKAESDFAPRAKSPGGARGLCQFMPATFEEWSVRLKIINPDPYNPEHSIECQAAYLAWLLNKLGERAKALAAYNWGIGNLLRVIKKTGEEARPSTSSEHPEALEGWKAELPEETQNYLARIETNLSRYRKELS